MTTVKIYSTTANTKKLAIIKFPDPNKISNQKTEVLNPCMHIKKFHLSTYGGGLKKCTFQKFSPPIHL